MSNGLSPYRGGGVSRFAQQSLMREQHVGLISAQRVRTIGMVAEIALWTVGNLSNVETMLIKQVPVAEARLGAIVDTATNAIAAEIARLAIG